MKIVEQRRKSRLSNNNFNIVDFELHGNSNNYAHLIKNRFRGGANPYQLNYECRLRTYKSKTDCKHSK